VAGDTEHEEATMTTDDTPSGSGPTPYPSNDPAGSGWGPAPAGGSPIPPYGAQAQPQAWGQGNAAPPWGHGSAVPPWGQGAGYPPPVAPVGGKGMAIAALVLGIIALLTSITVVGGVLLGILAVVFGIIARRRAKRGEAAGRGMATAGIVTGGLGLLVAVALIVLGVSLLNSKSGQDLQSCLRNAGSDQARIQACDNHYADQIGG
jgi:hypothetical protein